MKKIYLKLMALALLSVLSVTNAWATFTINGGTFYFDNSKTDWGQVALFVGKGGDGKYTNVYSMNKITNTKLYYYDMSSWGGATYIRFTGCTDWGSGSWGPENYNCSAGFTAAYTSDFTWNSSQHYLHTTSDGNDNATITPTHKGNTTGCIGSSKQTINVVVNGSTPGTAPADIDLESAYWTAYNAVTVSTTKKIRKNGTTVSDNYASAAYTAKTTLSVGTPNSGYYFLGWYDNSGNLLSSSTSYTYYPTAATTIYARFETRHTITVNANANGTITTPAGGSGNTVTAGYYTSAAIAASANTGYYFTSWGKNNNNVTIANDQSASTSVTATGTATVTASFAPMWAVVGGNSGSADGSDAMGDWSTTANEIQNITIAGGKTTGWVNITLDANTTYQFKMYNNSLSGTPTEKYWSYNGEDKVMVYPTDDNKVWQLYTGNNNSRITTAGKGTYKFTWNSTDHKLTVDFPTSYKITYGHGTGGSTTNASGNVSGSIANNKYVAAGENVTFTQTAASGYTFKEWNTQADGNGTQLAATTSYTISSISAAATVYAIYTPNTYKITFDATTNGGSISDNGDTYTEGGVQKINATYDAAVSGTMPTALKNGRRFAGWYTAAGTSYKVINADGTWRQVAGYTDASKHWILASNTTLYAHYDDPSFLSIDFSPEHAMPRADITATVSFNSTPGEPEGDYTLCYTLTTAEGIALKAQPEWRNQDDATHTVTFTAPSSPGDYSLYIKLFAGTGDVCGGNSPIATFQGGPGGGGGGNPYYFDVEEMNPITITYECGGVELLPSTTIYATWNNRATTTAPSIAGMTFDHWEYTNCTIEGGAAGRYDGAEATFYAFTAGSAKAVYTQGSLFFKNTLGWDHVYVYFYNSTSYWTTSSGYSEGTGSSTSNANFISGPLEMSLLDGTDDVYYFDEETHGTMPTFAAVAFTKESMSNYDYFAGPTATTDPCHVVYVNAFDKANKPMIVPVGNGALWNKKFAKYYSHDLAPLLQDWGALIKSNVDSYATTHHLKSAKMGDLSFSTTIYLPRYSYSYQWILTHSGTSYGRDSYPSLTYSSPTSDVLIANKGNLCAKTDVPGEYVFTVTYGTATGSEVYDGAATSDGLLKHATVTVTYPLKVGDYRLVYDDANLNPHPSDIIKKENNGEATVNMFYNPSATPVLKIQSCKTVATNKGDDVDPITWNSPTTIDLSSYSTVLTEAGVYNFTITLDASGANPAVTNVEKYTGRFYVRTDCVNSDKWNYKDSKDEHAMTYSDYSTTLATKPYSHYYVKDINGSSTSVNIRFTVATDNSETITDTVINGDAAGTYKDMWGSETLTRLTNVRFTYDQKTNKIWRAYTEGPATNGYMILRAKPSAAAKPYIYKSSNGVKGAQQDTLKFADMGNWVYQLDAFGDPGVYVKLTADIHNSAGTEITQYLKGIKNAAKAITEDTGFNQDSAVLLIGGSGDAQHMRITYDFKTERMTTAWLPSGTVSKDLSIHADVMLIRKHQQGAASIVIGKKDATNYAHLTDVGKAYGVMEFEKSYLNDLSLSRYERNLYWISLPFDVKLSDVFGFGQYGQHWIIEEYDGKGRAEKGYWADSEPNWKYVTKEVKDDYVLKANTGYILALALSNMTNSSSVWEGGKISSVYLYFPSKDNIGDITNISEYSMPLDSAGYKCKITRDHRDVKDSYWHCIGVPSFALNTLSGVSTNVPGEGEDWSTPLPYVYKWDSVYNTLSIASTSTFRFEAMKSYLIQYASDHIDWANVTNKSLARRKVQGKEASFYEWNLNLLSNGQHVDHTYVRLTNDENVTDGYDFGNDLSKEFNSGSNIYTFVDEIEVAGNVKPISTQTIVVPVGAKIAANGDYTFTMPEGTNGVGVVLVDNITGTHTNLAIEDYSIYLESGQYDERFYLEISPIAQMPTGIDLLDGENGANGVRKVMVDGMLYIVKDGKVFDAQGRQVK